jgi:predicted transcriptional regulator
LARKNRDEITLVVDLLKAASSGCGISQILLLANLSYNLAQKYLKISEDAKFLTTKHGVYQVTERGKRLIEKYDDFFRRYTEASKALDELAIERGKIKQLLKNASEQEQELPEELLISGALPMDSSPNVSCSLKRINIAQFLLELKELGFKSEYASEIVSWIDIINVNKPTFWSGHKIISIKSCLAYAGAKVLEPEIPVTQRKIALFYGIHPNYAQRNYNKYLQIIQKGKTNSNKVNPKGRFHHTQL